MSKQLRYACDTCNEAEAMTWVDNEGALCYDCARRHDPEPMQDAKSDETEPLDFDWVFG